LVEGAAWIVLAVGLVVLVGRAALRWWQQRRDRSRLSALRKFTAHRLETKSVAGRGSAGAGGEPVVRPDSISERMQRPPAPGSLIPQTLQRAIVAALAETEEAALIDIAAIVRQRATRRPGQPAHRRSRWTTGRGLDLHVDRSAAMEPFRSDIAAMQRALEGVAGANRVRTLGFDRDPRWATTPLALLDDDLEPRLMDELLPPSGTPVVVITDLGIAVPRSGRVTVEASTLLEHHRKLVAARLLPVYVVPYPRSRWPSGLEGLPIVEWSEVTRLAPLRRAIRRSRGGSAGVRRHGAMR
jgi:hypothetical protein